MTHRHGGHLENDTSEQTTQIIEQIELSGGTEECIKVSPVEGVWGWVGVGVG